jgi:hypothetical protein
MATTTGTVSFLKINNTPGSDFGLVAVKPTGGNDELFFVWWTPLDRTPATAPEWLTRSMQVSLLREACAQKLNVTIFHGDSSGIVTSVQLNGA